MSRPVLSGLLAVLLAAALCGSARAEERERIFLVFGGDAAETLEAEAAKFRSTVLSSPSPFEFAGASEMEEVYATCNEATGADASTRRDCQLRVANRIAVTQILELRARQLDASAYELVLEVWSAETNGLLFSAVEELEAASLDRAAREALPELAERYLCWRGTGMGCASATEEAPQGFAPAPAQDVDAGAPSDAPPTTSPSGAPDQPAKQTTIVFVPLHLEFEATTNALAATSFAALDEVAATMATLPGARFEIQGHTDSQGTGGHNQQRSQAHAEAVRDYLIGKGIEATRLTAVGYGETRPIDTNRTAEGRARNRRIEIVQQP